MKIAVTSTGKSTEDQVEPRFGRCPAFVIMDTDSGQVEGVDNPNLTLGSGAGIQSAQFMAQHEVEVILTGNCGPNAYQTLNAAGIEVVTGVSGKVGDAIQQFVSQSQHGTSGPTVPPHFGVGGGAGGGMGRGGGMGMGRGGGMGMGGGGGAGMGRGGGGGMGRGGGIGAAPGAGTQVPPAREYAGDAASRSDGSHPAGQAGDTEKELAALEEQAQAMARQLEAVNDRIGQLQRQQHKERRLVAAVHEDRCDACGACVSACPTDAITLDQVAVIDQQLCTGCGECIPECPQEAITLRRA